jgi:hypothetical protein
MPSSHAPFFTTYFFVARLGEAIRIVRIIDKALTQPVALLAMVRPKISISINLLMFYFTLAPMNLYLDRKTQPDDTHKRNSDFH